MHIRSEKYGFDHDRDQAFDGWDRRKRPTEEEAPLVNPGERELR